MERGTLDLSKLRFRVLDECDEMLNMGFVDDVEKILNAGALWVCAGGGCLVGACWFRRVFGVMRLVEAQIPPPHDHDPSHRAPGRPAVAAGADAPESEDKLQTMLFSATMPVWVKDITRRFLRKGHKLVDLVGDSKIKVR
jgi:superfamily II DNA/RNA helicase